jgi:hypothetical protein
MKIQDVTGIKLCPRVNSQLANLINLNGILRLENAKMKAKAARITQNYMKNYEMNNFEFLRLFSL